MVSDDEGFVKSDVVEVSRDMWKGEGRIKEGCRGQGEREGGRGGSPGEETGLRKRPHAGCCRVSVQAVTHTGKATQIFAFCWQRQRRAGEACLLFLGPAGGRRLVFLRREHHHLGDPLPLGTGHQQLGGGLLGWGRDQGRGAASAGRRVLGGGEGRREGGGARQEVVEEDGDPRLAPLEQAGGGGARFQEGEAGRGEAFPWQPEKRRSRTGEPRKREKTQRERKTDDGNTVRNTFVFPWEGRGGVLLGWEEGVWSWSASEIEGLSQRTGKAGQVCVCTHFKF